MALVACPECEKQISESASSCPNCGHPLATTQMTPAVTFPARNSLIAALVGAAAIVVGSLLPWVSIASPLGTEVNATSGTLVNFSGTVGDGVVTLIAGGLIGALAGVALSKGVASRLTGVLVAALGVVSGLLAVNAVLNLTKYIEDFGPSIGWGLWPVVLGSAVSIGSGFSTFSRSG